MNIVPKVWDSEFFNLKIAEIQVEENLSVQNSELEHYDLLYISSYNDHSIKIKGFEESYSGKLVCLRKNLSSSILLKKDLDIYCQKKIIPKKKEELYELAFESGKYSRFKLDKNFDDEHFKMLYRQWVNKAFSNNNSAGVLVQKEKGITLGFVTYDILGDEANIGLLGVRLDQQGRGIGTRLLEALEQFLNLNGIQTLEVKTQGKNQPAINFYKKTGFIEKELKVMKHFWKKNYPEKVSFNSNSF